MTRICKEWAFYECCQYEETKDCWFRHPRWHEGLRAECAEQVYAKHGACKGYFRDTCKLRADECRFAHPMSPEQHGRWFPTPTKQQEEEEEPEKKPEVSNPYALLADLEDST